MKYEVTVVVTSASRIRRKVAMPRAVSELTITVRDWVLMCVPVPGRSPRGSDAGK
jgi:hypothetical protein